MRSVTFAPRAGFRVEHMAAPQIAADEVLVKVDACGICGSDRQVFRGESVPVGTEFPLVMGHEIAGSIERVGAGVTAWTAGTRVVVHPFIACGDCSPCRHGQSNLCIRQVCIGYQRSGGFSEFVVVPENQLIAIPDALSADSAALLVDAFATPLHAMRAATVNTSTTLLVMGGGGLGMAALMLAKAHDVAKIGAVARRATHISSLEDYGAQLAVSMEDDKRSIARMIRRFAGADGIDVVIDTIGDERSTRFAADVVRPGGIVSILGMSDEDATFPIAKMVRRGVRCQFSYGSQKDDVELLVKLVDDGRLSPTALIGDSVSMDRLSVAFASERKNGRYVLHPWDGGHQAR